MTDPMAYRLASNTIKAELARAGIGYQELVDRLHTIGVQETYRSIASKVHRGAFSFAFFMQCMEAIDHKVVRLRE